MDSIPRGTELCPVPQKEKKKKGGAATWGRGLYLEPGENMELDHCDRSRYERCPELSRHLQLRSR